MDSIQAIIVDDERPARSRLQSLCRESDVEVVGVGRNGLEGIKLIRTHRPDLLFLDVQMPGLDGFGVLREIGWEQMPLTIFVTAHDKYAIRAFEIHAIDYLLKPYSDERFEAALKQARKTLTMGAKEPPSLASKLRDRPSENAKDVSRSGYLERIAVKAGGKIVFLNVGDIDWIEAAGVYVHLHIGATTHLYRSSVVHLVERLNPAQFIRLHRSAVVNTARIRELYPRSHGDYTVVLQNGTELLMSRAYRSGLETWLRQPL